MSSGSFKDTAKALNGAFANQTHLQDLPKEILQAIDAYLERHKESDEHDIQRLQEELLAIHSKFVAKEPGNLGALLQLLKALRPGISSQTCLHEWWTLVIQPIIDGLGHTRSEISHASDCLLAILDYDVDDDKDGEKAKISTHFAKVLLDAYIKRTRVHDTDGEVFNGEDDFVAQQLSDVLVAYGRKKPKDLMVAVDRLFIVKEQRMQALGLISTFVQSQPPHLYLVRETPLVEHLLQCLLVDTSTTVISLALTTLIMFLPHIPSSVRAHLPRLFLIYSRLLCWERYRPTSHGEEREPDIEEEDEDEYSEGEEVSAPAAPEEIWDKLESSFDNAESTTPELLHYFTFLYGLYPLNFTNYVRKPRKYLKSINFPRADEFDLDQKVIRLRTEPFSRLHLLHPSFINTTLEDELTENRWLKTDPVDVVAECISLCLTTLNPMVEVAQSAPAKASNIPPAYVKTEDIPSESLLGYADESSFVVNDTQSTTEGGSAPPWRAVLGHIEPSASMHRSPLHGHGTPNSQSTGLSSPASHPRDRDALGDSPTLGSTTTPRMRAASRPGRHGSVASLPSGIEQSPRSSAVHMPSRDDLPRSPALRPTGSHSDVNLAFLQREVTLLKNDLTFERYLKQQHLTHIGQLQRKHIREATIEAETQNLINNNRTLKNKLAEANKAYALLKKETATNRSQSKKYEAELTGKVRGLKDDERQWRAEEETFRAELAKAQDERDHLRQLVVDSEAKELLARQNITSTTLKLEQLESLYKRVQELEAKVHAYEARELEFEQARDEKEILTTELATAELRLKSRDSDFERERRTNDRRLQDLEAQLQAAQNPTAGAPPGQLAPQAQHLIDQAVAASKVKYAALKKEHVRLQHQFLELEIRCKELEQAAADATYTASSSHGSRHQSPLSNVDIAGNSPTTSNGIGSGSSSYTRRNPIPIPAGNNTNDSIASSPSSSITSSSRARSIAPPRPTTTPGLDLRNLPSHSPTKTYATSPPPLPPFPTSLSNPSSPGGRLHRTGTLKPQSNTPRASSPVSRSAASNITTTESMRTSRANSSFEDQSVSNISTTPTSSNNTTIGSGWREGNTTRHGPYSMTSSANNTTSAFSLNSFDSRGADSQMSKHSGAASGVGSSSSDANKISAKSEVRVYGRGGAQNIGKAKESSKDDEQRRKEKREKSKAGGLLGIRGII